MNTRFLMLLVVMALGLGGCATNSASQQVEAEANAGDPRDPLEPINRAVWDFNYDVLDAYILRPITVGYVTVMPEVARKGLLNAAQNLEEPVNFVNNLLQGKAAESFDSAFRFVINSTVGLAGTIDVAGAIGVERQEEDFDEVMGVWGIGNGPYLMIPAAGPNDVRGVTGEVVDNLYFPATYLNSNWTLLRWSVELLETRALFMEQEQQLEASADSYAFVKSAYFQNKAFQVNDGEVEEEQLDEDELEDFEAFEDMLDDIDY
ncbi:VacJ family lipoprotein [Alteromonas sp. ASW11-36]|uniref:VacJ family lipoprotein n=1 Tax=Alteromonas arenosi TaxID=3055817 RepID=A0ABT7T0L0_9ALTE|nr:VacJ family lipoprotein [Alteromonas sp. ASW11-36]MDM7861965.1 VacJ family lipoprotein [Alteromonas sp. ASW11-36]